MLEEAEEAKLEFRLIDILMRREGLLAVIALNEALEFVLCCMLL